jgi:glycosyltransferase involved in cell wall biosynthesis
MKIGINCLRLDPDYVGGLNTYTLGLLQGFASVGNNHTFHLYGTDRNQVLFRKFEGDTRFVFSAMTQRDFRIRQRLSRAALLSANSDIFRRVSNGLYRDLREKMDEEVDLVYTPTDLMQAFDYRRPTVLSIHDLQHVHYPEFFSWARRLSRRITYRLSADVATRLQASSRFVRQDLLSQFRSLRPEKIEVIPEGVNVEEFSIRRDGSKLWARYGVADKFLLYPAQLWPHKNHMTLLRALKHLEETAGVKIPLVLSGGKFGAARSVLKFIEDQKMTYVRYLGKVPFEDLAGLYQSAAFLICPSLFESSSLPILEAAASSTPIIASRIPANIEHAEVLQINLFDPLDHVDLARTILPLWNDNRSARAQAAYNRRQVGQFSWENVARSYLRLFEAAAAN